jgi:hypothetical protein
MRRCCVLSLLYVACCEGLFCVVRVLSCELSVLCVVNGYYLLCAVCFLFSWCFDGLICIMIVLRWAAACCLSCVLPALCCALYIFCAL